MAIQQRKDRERAQRRQLIITTARRLAEAEGWDAVTTRRLAELIEYSQPVLYSHFTGMDAIMGAVALQGFAELAAALRPHHEPGAFARAYCDFAEANPALYDAMFTRTVPLPFAQEGRPEALSTAFQTLQEVFGIYAEVVWSALHGVVTLTRGGRLLPQAKEQRMAILVRMLHSGAVA
jgi:AcrR family transcriptional regulator